MQASNKNTVLSLFAYYLKIFNVNYVRVKSVNLKCESCIVKKDCSKSENKVKYFQESELYENENELHKGV